MFSKYLLNEWMNKNTQDPSKSAPWLPFQLHQLSFSQPLVLRCQQNKWPFVFWKCHASLVCHRLYLWASFIWNCHPNNLSALARSSSIAISCMKPSSSPQGSLRHSCLHVPTQPAEVPSMLAMLQCHWEKKPSRYEQILDRSNSNLKKIEIWVVAYMKMWDVLSSVQSKILKLGEQNFNLLIASWYLAHISFNTVR